MFSNTPRFFVVSAPRCPFYPSRGRCLNLPGQEHRDAAYVFITVVTLFCAVRFEKDFPRKPCIVCWYLWYLLRNLGIRFPSMAYTRCSTTLRKCFNCLWLVKVFPCRSRIWRRHQFLLPFCGSEILSPYIRSVTHNFFSSISVTFHYRGSVPVINRTLVRCSSPQPGSSTG